MDYKTNALAEQLECKNILFPDFPTLLFGQIPNGPLVFDSNSFCLTNKIEDFDYKIFQRTNKRYIEGIIDNVNMDRSQLFYINKDNHVLINQELVLLFMSFVMPDLCGYFNGLLGEALTNGVAYSDGFILNMAAERIPTDVLQEIINKRNETE